jgi:hypothetical protein
VDNANEGDEIVVCPGTYVENIEVDKPMSIRSYGGAANTIHVCSVKYLWPTKPKEKTYKKYFMDTD